MVQATCWAAGGGLGAEPGGRHIVALLGGGTEGWGTFSWGKVPAGPQCCPRRPSAAIPTEAETAAPMSSLGHDVATCGAGSGKPGSEVPVDELLT